jgi:hypothetical protein
MKGYALAEASRENMELLEEMESERFSDIQSNEP